MLTAALAWPSAPAPSWASAQVPGERAADAAQPRAVADGRADSAATRADDARLRDAQLPHRADGADIFADVPPPSTYDRLGKDGAPTLAPESLGLITQLGRTLMALAAVLALLYLAFKLLMPHVMKRLGPQRVQNLQLKERLMLDGKNSMVAVEHKDGRTFYLGCSDGAVSLLACDAAPPGGPSASRLPRLQADAASAQPRPENFAEVLGQPAERPPAAAP